jgi:hypothetical protein
MVSAVDPGALTSGSVRAICSPATVLVAAAAVSLGACGEPSPDTAQPSDATANAIPRTSKQRDIIMFVLLLMFILIGCERNYWRIYELPTRQDSAFASCPESGQWVEERPAGGHCHAGRASSPGVLGPWSLAPALRAAHLKSTCTV